MSKLVRLERRGEQRRGIYDYMKTALDKVNKVKGQAVNARSQGEASIESSKWLLEHLLHQKHADLAVRSLSHRMNMAKLPTHRDLEGAYPSQDKELVSLAFMDTAQNVVFIGRLRTCNTRLATALAVSGITTHKKRVHFCSTLDLVSLLAREKYEGKTSRIAQGRLRADLGILDELGYLPFSQSGGALLCHLLSKLYERISVLITTTIISFSEWSSAIADAKMTMALPDRLTHRCRVVEMVMSPTAFNTATCLIRRKSSHVNER